MDETLRRQLEESRYIRRSMKADTADSGHERWARKPVVKTRQVPMAGRFSTLIHTGPGTMHIDRETCRTDEGSVRLDFPVATPIRHYNNRAYAIVTMRVPFEGEDLRGFNRMSAWIRFDAPGFSWRSVNVSIHNEGEHVMPVPGRFEGIHHMDAVCGEWTQIVWEIPDIYRDKVTGISFATSMNGSLPNAANDVSLFIDDLRLEVVEELENTRGFDLKKNAIAYCHSGYLPGARKQALVQHIKADAFSIIDGEGKAVYTAATQPCEDGFLLLDFSNVTAEGRYTIEVGDIRSKPFAIGGDAFLSAAWKALSFFYTERCGFDVPELHVECHLDTVCRHPDGRTVLIHGGWHDAADLSQAVDKTVDIIVGMLDLADATKETQPDLSDRVLEEARWGLNWVMRTRFGDGYRHVALTKSLWTKNLRGDQDDMTGEARYTAIHNYTAAYTCAYAVPFFADWDKLFADWCLRCAHEDFYFAEAKIDHCTERDLMVERYSEAVSVAAMLYRVTGDKQYLDAAAVRAQHLIQCQQLERRTDFSIPLHGFFYEDRTKSRPMAYYHRSTEQFVMRGLTMLLTDAPDHPDAGLWRQSVDAYADYIRETAHVMEPYGILPAGVYELGNAEFGKLSHEGARDIGAPSIEEHNAQVRNGVKLNDRFYLRRFPVAFQFRGFHGTLLSKTKNVFNLARFYHDKELYDIAVRQLEYVLGFNPFAMSTMYGEGYEYPLYDGGAAGQPVGAVPVGFETFENDDEPFWPMQSNCTYKEVWVCTTARAMWSIAEAYKGY